MTTRSGLWLRLETEAEVRWAEIAPWPSFGSETLEQAIAFCESLPEQLTWEQLEAIPIPAQLPACQFGFGCLRSPLTEPDIMPTSAVLLPAGSAAVEAIDRLPAATTYKWKIGFDLESELAILSQLDWRLPPEARLRLDANGGLDRGHADLWLQALTQINQRQPERIEWLEQPLAPSQSTELLALAEDWPSVPIALDESVTTVEQLVFWSERQWPGRYVLKPAIAGSPQTLIQFCQSRSLPVVISSMFESPIGWRQVAAIAALLGNPEQAQGLGTTAWFNDDWDALTPEELWQHRSSC